MFSSSKEQKDTLKFDEKKEKLIQTAVEWIKVTLRYGGHNLKKIGSTNGREKETLGCQEWLFTKFIEN